MSDSSTIELIGHALADAIRSGEIAPTDQRRAHRFAAEYIGTMVPEMDYLEFERLCPFSLAVGAVIAAAHFELMKEG